MISDEEMLARPPAEADHRERYGDHPLHFGDLYLPRGAGPHPVVVVLHGGCWRAIADLAYMSHLARELAQAGWAAWSLEFRPIDRDGGAWPAILEDAAAGIDHLAKLTSRHELELDRVAVLGHSAGGHLALWLASRGSLRPGDPGGARNEDGASPVLPCAVVGLAAITDLAEFHGRRDVGCRGAVADLLGGPPGETGSRLRVASPAERLPSGVPALLVTGTGDDTVPPGHGEAFARRARDAGDRVELHTPECGHFEVVAPWSEAWPGVFGRVRQFLSEVSPGAGKA